MYKHILIATDGSELAGKAIAAGFDLARSLGAKVTAVTVTEPWTAVISGEAAIAFPLEEYEKSANESASRILSGVSTMARKADIGCATVHAKDQYASEEIWKRPRKAAVTSSSWHRTVDGASEGCCLAAWQSRFSLTASFLCSSAGSRTSAPSRNRGPPTPSSRPTRGPQPDPRPLSSTTSNARPRGARSLPDAPHQGSACPGYIRRSRSGGRGDLIHRSSICADGLGGFKAGTGTVRAPVQWLSHRGARFGGHDQRGRPDVRRHRRSTRCNR